MRRFIRYLKAAWLYSQFFPYTAEADMDGFWTVADSEKAYQFFQQTQTGQKLCMRLRNYAISSALAAVKNPSNSSYNNGVAAGIAMLIVAIENLSAGVPTDTESEQSEAGGLDQLDEQTA